MVPDKNKYPWVESESNLTKEEWEAHRDWVFGFCGTVVGAGKEIEGGRYYKVEAYNRVLH